jgi:hypothetical protein
MIFQVSSSRRVLERPSIRRSRGRCGRRCWRSRPAASVVVGSAGLSAEKMGKMKSVPFKPSLSGVKAENVDATAEQLWQRIVRENPRASDEEIEYLYLGALIDLFKDMRKRLSN